MIRQAISCDICGTEKKQTNHWFVAYDQGDELRISGWTSRNRLRPGSRHLCGQTCMHKLVDEFMARMIAVRVQPGAPDEAAAEISAPDNSVAVPAVRPAASRNPVPARSIALQPPIGPIDRPHPAPEVSALRPLAPTDGSLTSAESSEPDLDFESSARLISPAAPSVSRRPPLRAQPELVSMPGRPHLEESPTSDEPPRLATRNWRAEAWDREREREQRANRDTGTSSRRRSGF